MKRRQFVGLLAAASLPGRAVLARGQAKNVLVLGAGLAGLVAAYELTRAGHEVTVLEARARPGGRVQTLREPFAAGLHAEAGALFVPQNHELTVRYARSFGLALEPAFPLLDVRLYYVRGRRVVAGAASSEWPYELTAEERKLGRTALWTRYVADAAPLAMPAATEGLADRRAAIDRMNGAAFLRSRGASPEAVALLRTGYLDLFADGIESYSALEMLERVAQSAGAGGRYYRIAEGSDALVRAFAARLGGRIRYGAAVVRLEPGERSVAVVARTRAGRERLRAERVVCTLPFSVLRGIAVEPDFPAPKRQAIDALAYTSVTRVFLQFGEKVWAQDNPYLLTSTDLAFRQLFEHTAGAPGRRGILEAQAVGAEAERLGRLPEGERIAAALACVEQVFPGARRHYERGTSKCWGTDPWARGAFAYFRPGEVLALRPHLGTAEGRVHFAGDHTSPWSGWMQGALESGLRAAAEVGEAA